MRRVALLIVAPAFVFLGGCGGGADASDVDSGTGSGDGGRSGTDGGSPGSSCTEFHAGGTNDPGLGGSRESQVAAQVTADIAGAAALQIGQLTQSCKTIASTLDAPADRRAAAEAQSSPSDKAKAWCALAVTALSAAEANVGGVVRVTYEAPKCRLSVDAKAACQGRCSGSPCDVVANPMRCTGGTLSNGICEGGTLEGGCNVEAKCNANCDMSVTSVAECPAPAITAEVMGPADPAAAMKLEDLLRAELPEMIALRAHLEAEVSLVAVFTANLGAVTDIKAACIPAVVASAHNAVASLATGARASGDVVSTVD